MKRLILLCLCIFLLCGCGGPEEPTVPATEPAPTVTEAPTEPAGLYDPDNPVEEVSLGAVKAYPLEGSDTQGIAFMGQDVLVFSTFEYTTLTRLSGDTLYPSATVSLDCSFYPMDPSVQVSEKGITYYDNNTLDLVFLDTDLKEVNRIHLPEEIIDIPALTADRKNLYYLTDASLRCLDLDTGIDRLVKEMWFSYQSISALHCDETIIECGISDEEGNWRRLYLSTDTGELLYEALDYHNLYTHGDLYFTTRMDGTYTEFLTGTADGPVKMLYSPDFQPSAYPVLERGGIITMTQDPDSVTLDYYRLDQGIRPYCLTLPGDYVPWNITAQPGTDHIWFQAYAPNTDTDTLYCWDLSKSPVADDTVYIGPRRTADEPDTYGLENCAQFADRISQKYGIEVLTWTQVLDTEPWDYHFEAEYQVSVLYNALTALDAYLAVFPESFFADMTSEMGDGILRIALVRDIVGNENNNALAYADGLQFWDDDFNAFVALKICDNMEQNLYHELFHVAESRIFSHSSAFDNWDELNPAGFSYDYSYADYLNRMDYELLEGDSRAFIDIYSMTIPKEDRARIMDYA